MAYCRFGDDSDVYLFYHVDGFFECCMCRLSKMITVEPNDLLRDIGITEPFQIYDNLEFQTKGEALRHLYEHVNVGHKVSKYAIKELKKEMRKNKE